MQSRQVDLDLRAAIFSVRLSDLMARELILSGQKFQFDAEPIPCSASETPDSDAQPLAEKLWADINGDPALPESIDPSKADISFAISEKLGRQLELLQVDDSRRLGLQLNRATASLLRKSLDSADEDVDAVLVHDAWHPRALLIKSRIQFYCGNLQASVASLQQVRGAEVSDAVAVMAESCIASGDNSQAQSLFSRLHEGVDEDLRVRLDARLLRACDSKNGIEADDLIRALSFQNAHPLAELAISEHMFISGRHSEAIERLAGLERDSAQNARLWYMWQIGRMQFLSGSYLTATDWYGRICPDESDSLQHREFVHALYRAGLLPAAQKRARAIRGKMGRVAAGVTEIEADCLAQAGKFAEARQLLEELISDRPQSGHLLLSLARLHAASGDADKAGQCLSRIDLAKLPPELHTAVNELAQELEQFRAT